MNTATSNIPAEQGLIITGCSRRKCPTATPMAALDLYQEACVPPLRARFGTHVSLRARIRIVSARHGLLTPDTEIRPYDQKLDSLEEAEALGERIAAPLGAALTGVRHVVAILEPLYFRALQPGLVCADDLVDLAWIADPFGWDQAAAVLDTWGWT